MKDTMLEYLKTFHIKEINVEKIIDFFVLEVKDYEKIEYTFKNGYFSNGLAAFIDGSYKFNLGNLSKITSDGFKTNSINYRYFYPQEIKRHYNLEIE